MSPLAARGFKPPRRQARQDHPRSEYRLQAEVVQGLQPRSHDPFFQGEKGIAGLKSAYATSLHYFRALACIGVDSRPPFALFAFFAVKKTIHSRPFAPIRVHWRFPLGVLVVLAVHHCMRLAGRAA